MGNHILLLPDGTKVSSGTPGQTAIQSITLTRRVNAGQELTIGSACAGMLEATLFDPAGSLGLQPGESVTLFRTDDAGAQQQEGVFFLESALRPSANTLKITLFDPVSKLDRDLTVWVGSLESWPYDAVTFASMVCSACGLTFIPEEVPNGDYLIERFSIDGVTGRQIMQWLGQLCCRYVYADPAGNLRMGWYKPLSTTAIGPREDTYCIVKRDIHPTFRSEEVSDTYTDGDLAVDSPRFTVTDDGQGNVVLTVDEPVESLYYLQNGMQFESYATAPIDGVQIAFSAEASGWRWPERPGTDNCYVISGNPFLAATTQIVAQALEKIHAQLLSVSYTPCKVSVAAGAGVDAGDILQVQDTTGRKLTVLVMQKITKGQLDTLICTGSPRRDSTLAVSNDSANRLLEQKLQRRELLKRLTENGLDDAIFLQDGKLAIKATAIVTGILQGIEIIGQSGSIGGLTITDHSLSTTYRRDFSDLTEEDISRILAIGQGADATEEEIYRYDINMNGRIDSGDGVLLQRMLEGEIPNYTEGRIVIDAKNPTQCVSLEVTGGYRMGEKTVLGMGRVSSDSFACGGREGYTGTLQLGDQTLTVAGGIIVKE